MNRFAVIRLALAALGGGLTASVLFFIISVGAGGRLNGGAVFSAGWLVPLVAGGVASAVAWLLAAPLRLRKDVEPGKPSDQASCPSCGGDIYPDWRLCPHCGVMLSSESEMTAGC